MADDAAMAYWNPAGLAQLRTMEVTGMGATMFEDTRYGFLALGMPTDSWGTFALSGIFTTSGEFERATWDEDLDETFSERETVISLGWAGSYKRFAYGGTVKAVSQDIGGASGGSMGVDVGAYYRPHRLLSIGGAVQNLVTPKITLVDTEEEYAQSARVGLALRFFNSNLLLSSDIVKTKWMDTSFRTGLEAWPISQLALRGGYDTEREQFSAGAGFRLSSWQFDYAYVNTDLGGQNVLSATVRFGVPFGVKVNSDKALFSPNGDDREVQFDIKTAVRGDIESWQVVIVDQDQNVVRTLSGNGEPPEMVIWRGEDEDGRMVGDGTYQARASIVDSLGEVVEPHHERGSARVHGQDAGTHPCRNQRQRTVVARGDRIMASRVFLMTAAAVLTVALLGPVTSVLAGDENREMEVPTESALWEAAGRAYEAGVDKSAAMQQYRLFVQSYGGSERAASAQYMVGECYFAAEDYEGALREYAMVGGPQGP